MLALLWTELCHPPNPHDEALIPSVIVFEDRPFKE